MRLIKLSTTDAQGQFNTNFNTDIDLKPGAQIALKSASFEPVLEGFNSNSFNGQFSMRADSDLVMDFGTPIIRHGTYSIGDERELLFRLNTALNRGLGITSPRSKGQSTPTCLSQYLVYKRNEKVFIEMRLSPFISPILQTNITGTGAYFIQPPAPLNDILRLGGEVVGIKNTNAVTIDQRYRLTTPNEVGLSKGGGVFLAQINKAVVSGAPTQNGFGMGIAFHRPQLEDILGTFSTNPRCVNGGVQTMPPRSRCCEIDFQDTNNNYRFISEGFGQNTTGNGAFQDAGFSAHQVTTDDDGNDIIMFEIDTEADNQKVIRGSVIKLDGGGSFTKQVLFTQILSEEEQNVYSTSTETADVMRADSDETLGIDFVPYIYFRGNEDTIELKNIRVSLNPFVTPEDFGGTGENLFELENPALPAEGLTLVGEVDAALIGCIPPADDGLADFDLSIFITRHVTTRLTLEAELAKTLGFAHITQTRDTIFEPSEEFMVDNGVGDEFMIARALIKAHKVTSFEREQLYIIELQSFDILSYNSGALTLTNKNNPTFIASKNFSGDRKNILDVILHNDREDGLLIHEPNNINFIDIANTTKFNLRNLRLRIVNDDFLPIDVVGVSHLVMLIKD